MYGKDTSSLLSVALLVNASSDEPSRRDVVIILFSSSLKALAFLTRGRETKSFRALSK